MLDDASVTKPRRLAGRKPGPAQRDEMLRIWGYVDDDCR